MMRQTERTLPTRTLESCFRTTAAAALLTVMLPITGCSPQPDDARLPADENISSDTGSAPSVSSGAEDRSGGKEPPPIAPVTGEVLLASAPQGWVESGTLISPVMRMAEFVPEAQAEAEKQEEEAPSGEATTASQSVEASADGTPAEEERTVRLDRLTIESQSGDPVPDPIDFVLSLSRDLALRCEGFSDFNIMSGMENNYATSVRLLVCPRYKDQPLGEVLMIKAIQGREYFYTVTRGRRLPAFNSDEQPLTAQTMAEWSAYLKSVGVCDPRWPEHPCPDDINTFAPPRAG